MVAVLGQPRAGPLLTNDYFDQYLVSVPNLIAGIVIGLLLTAAAIRPPSWRWLARAREVVGRGPVWRWVALAIAIAVTVIWLLPAVNTDATAPRAGNLASGHFRDPGGRLLLRRQRADPAGQLHLPVLESAAPCARARAEGRRTVDHLVVDQHVRALSDRDGRDLRRRSQQVTRGAWTALALYVPWVALSLFPWNDVGPYREFNGIYYGVLPGSLLRPVPARTALCHLVARPSPLHLRALPVRGAGPAQQLRIRNRRPACPDRSRFAAGRDRDLPLRRRPLRPAASGGAGLLTAIALVCAITLIRTGELPDPALLTYYNRVFLLRLLWARAHALARGALGPLRHVRGGPTGRGGAPSSAVNRTAS